MFLAISASSQWNGDIGGKIVSGWSKEVFVKVKTGLLVLSLLFCQLAAKVQAQTSGVIFQKQFTVPGPNPEQTLQGVNASFTVTQTSTITFNLTTNLSSPALNVYVLYPDNYAFYKVTGSLAKATPLKNLTQLNTASYKAQGILNCGNFGLVIQWAQANVFATEPSVTVEIDAAPYVLAASTAVIK